MEMYIKQEMNEEKELLFLFYDPVIFSLLCICTNNIS